MKLFIYCAGGFGKEIFDTARRINNTTRQWKDIAFIDDNPSLGGEFYGAALYTFERALEQFHKSDFEVSIANGEPFVRKAIYEKLKSHNIQLATIIDNSAIVSESATIGEGVIVTAYCSISSHAVVEKNVAINTKSIIGHDVKVGSHSVISSLVNLGGGCPVGEHAYIGMGAQVKEGLVIGKDVIVGMGSVVHHDIPDGVIALGNPARPMRPNVDKRVFHRGAVR